jgi:hypothetical protein
MGCGAPRLHTWMDAWPSKNLICSRSPPFLRQSFAQVWRRSWAPKCSIPMAPIARPRSKLPSRSIPLPRRTLFWRPAEQPSGAVAGGSRPGVHRELDPNGDGYCANAVAFAAEIGDHPAALALLNILHLERGQLGPAQSAARHLSGVSVDFIASILRGIILSEAGVAQW